MTVTQDFSQFHSRLKDEPSSLKVASSIYYLHSVLECQIELILDFGLFVALPTLFFGTLELATFTIDVNWNETSKLANISFSF